MAEIKKKKFTNVSRNIFCAEYFDMFKIKIKIQFFI